MYLRTPKRYQPGRRRRQLGLISRRTIVYLLLITGLGTLGWYLWNHQAEVRSAVVPQIESLADDMQTRVAPRPTATVTPDLEVAQSGCMAAYQQGDLEEAVSQCRTLAEGSPNDINIHYQVTHLMIITSNFGSDAERINSALEFAEKTINANPELPHGWAIRAMALDWSGNYGAALASALHARALDENFGPTYAFLAEIYHDLGQDETALSYIEQAKTLDTGGLAIADALRTEGLIYSDQGYWEDAIQPYQRALEIAPNHTYIAVELANNYVALNELDDAIGVLDGALQKNPNDPMVLFTLANVYTRSGEKEKAFEFYHRCLDTNPDNVLCLSYLGGLQFYENDFVSAINNLKRAIDLGSDNPEDFWQLGQSYFYQDRCDLAIPYLQQGYQLAAANEDANNLAKLVSILESCNAPIPQGVIGPTPTEATETSTPTP